MAFHCGLQFTCEAIDQLLPFRSPRLSQCRRQSVDLQKRQLRLGQLLADIAKHLVRIDQPVDGQLELRVSADRRQNG